MERLTTTAALAKLSGESGKEFIGLHKYGSLEIEIYKPHKVDPQNPHNRDELYVVISGSGIFMKDGVRQPFQAGEVLCVPAGIEHRFEGFTDDFSTWVFFYGPEGGETP